MRRGCAERARRVGGITGTSDADVHRCERRPDGGAFSRCSMRAVLLLAGICLLVLPRVALGVGSGAPVDESAPSLAGTARDGLRLKTVKGSWSGQTPLLYGYSWRRCDASGSACEGIAGASKASYKVTHQDVGHTLRVTVTATNEVGAASATSGPSAIVAPAPPVKKGAPKVTGSGQDGQLMSASTGTWKGTPPFSYSYRWEACNALGEACAIIPGATEASYRAASSQIGGRLRVIVTAANSVGSASATSAASKRIVPGPPVSTAPPVISGSLQEGQTLTAATGGWGGTGPFSYTYQWQRCPIAGGGCQDIAGASGPTYTLGIADLASKLVVVVTATSSLGTALASSAETSPVAAILPAVNVLPQITGLLQDGQLLSVGTGIWSGTEPISFSYQWRLCDALGVSCSDIAGATGPSLKLSPADIAGVLDVVVTATNAAGSTSVTSSVTGLIAGLLPTNTGLPSISGLLQDGQLLSASPGSWSGSGPISFSYQWQQCNAAGGACKDISGATGSTLNLLSGLIGSTLDVVVTATNAAGSTSATTPVSSLVAGLLPTNTGLPSISGLLQDGQLLSASPGSWSGSGQISFSYQWQQCNAAGKACTDISGATESTLSLLTGLIGSTVDLVVTATNVAGSTSATTPVSGLIAGILPSNTGLPSISGLLQEGQSASVSTGAWTGSSPISYSYQWQQCNATGKSCTNISAATGSTLGLLSGLIGSTLDVVVTATNVAGSTSVTSPVSGLVTGLLPSNTALPSISGLLQEGQSASVSNGSWTGTQPISYSYHWQECNGEGKACTNIAGATGSTLGLVTALIGRTLDVVVTATNSVGSTSVTTPVTGLVKGILPSNTALPTISGLAKVGQLLTAVTGTWTGTAPISFAYQWQLCELLDHSKCTNIAGATGSTFLLGLLDLGLPVRVLVTATNVAGSTVVPSAVTALIAGLGLNPIAGPASGGTSVTLSASGVSAATSVHFGSKEASEVEVVSPDEITAQAPPGSGTVPVTVSTPEGTTEETPVDQYTYR